MSWAVHSLNLPARPQIEIAIAGIYGVITLFLIAKFASASQQARPRQASSRADPTHLQATWTTQLGNALIAAAGRLDQQQPHTVQAVQKAISNGGIAGISAGIAKLSEQAALPVAPAEDVVQAQASMTIARRVLTMVRKALQELDILERKTDDPAALKALYSVDELVTRVRRAVETLAALGGAIPRSATGPEELNTLLRQAVAEIEDYRRVRILPPVKGRVHGVAAADIIHLLAELLENATKFSRPDTEVTARVQEVASGLAIDIDDRGLGMDRTGYERACALLSGIDLGQVHQRLDDGQLGFLASAAFAGRHGISVLVEPNLFGGVRASVLLPQALLATSTAGATDASRQATILARAPMAGLGDAAYPGQELNRRPDLVGSAARPSLPRRDGSYLSGQPSAPGPGPQPTGMSPALLAKYHSGLRTGAGEQPSDRIDGDTPPQLEA
ncbi:hypothetical protein [Catenulispora sp. GAS73]|uniref:hypothetical protein n=1 Tax=Catenulispora sp. GAS73 TaxID=3156269 RepID=UPI00351961A5